MGEFKNFRFLVAQEDDDGKVIQQGPHQKKIGQHLLVGNVQHNQGDTPPGLSEPGSKTFKRPVQFQSQFWNYSSHFPPSVAKHFIRRMAVTDYIHGSPFIPFSLPAHACLLGRRLFLSLPCLLQ
jgi:hypothetical protein